MLSEAHMFFLAPHVPAHCTLHIHIYTHTHIYIYIFIHIYIYIHLLYIYTYTFHTTIAVDAYGRHYVLMIVGRQTLFAFSLRSHVHSV